MSNEGTPITLYTTSFNPAKLSERSFFIISFIFENGGATTTEIVKKVQEQPKWGEAPRNGIVRHIYNLRNYGLISKILKIWTLTQEGVKVLELLTQEDGKVSKLLYKKEQVKKYYKKQSMYHVELDTSTYNKLHTINNIIINNNKINKITNQILHILENKLNKHLTNSEKEVVEKLFAHALETGGEKSLTFASQKINDGKLSLGSNNKYLPSVVVAERFFNFNDFHEFQSIFTSLANKGIAYLYIDKKLEYTKVGIKKYLYDTLAVYYPELGLVMRTRPRKVVRIGYSN